MKLLIVRNLNLRYLELSTQYVDNAKLLASIHDLDFVVIAGNISKHEKRSILFAEELQKGLRDFNLPVIYNQGVLELCNIGTIEAVRNGVMTRVKMHQEETNVWWPSSFKHPEIEFQERINWPIIDDTTENFRKTVPGRWLSSGRRALVVNGELFDDTFPFPFEIDEFNELHKSEQKPEWSETKKKILLSTFDPAQDDLLKVNYKNVNDFGQDVIISSSGPQFEIIEV